MNAAGSRIRRRREAEHGWLYVSPWIAGFLVFTLYPVLASLYYGFTSFNGLSTPQWLGLWNYGSILKDELFWKSIYNNLFLSLFGVSFAQLTSLLAALLLNRALKGIGAFRTIFFLPSVVPAVATSLLWKWIFNPEFGPINTAIEAIGLPSPGWLQDPAWAKPALILMGVWGIGGTMVIYLAGLKNVPNDLYESAELDGAGRVAKLFSITLPCLKPVILFNLVMGIITSFQSFTSIFIMTNGGPENSTLVYALYIYQNGFQFYKMGYASAMAWILLLLTLGSVTLVYRLLGRAEAGAGSQ